MGRAGPRKGGAWCAPRRTAAVRSAARSTRSAASRMGGAGSSGLQAGALPRRRSLTCARADRGGDILGGVRDGEAVPAAEGGDVVRGLDGGAERRRDGAEAQLVDLDDSVDERVLDALLAA